MGCIFLLSLIRRRQRNEILLLLKHDDLWIGSTALVACTVSTSAHICVCLCECMCSPVESHRDMFMCMCCTHVCMCLQNAACPLCKCVCDCNVKQCVQLVNLILLTLYECDFNSPLPLNHNNKSTL